MNYSLYRALCINNSIFGNIYVKLQRDATAEQVCSGIKYELFEDTTYENVTLYKNGILIDGKNICPTPVEFIVGPSWKEVLDGMKRTFNDSEEFTTFYNKILKLPTSITQTANFHLIILNIPKNKNMFLDIYDIISSEKNLEEFKDRFMDCLQIKPIEISIYRRSKYFCYINTTTDTYVYGRRCLEGVWYWAKS